MRVAGIRLLMPAAGAAPADEQTLVLQEHVNRDWKRELVSFLARLSEFRFARPLPARPAGERAWWLEQRPN
jgi:hypothetical protein